MLLGLGVGLSFLILVYCVLNQLSLALALLICWLIFAGLALREQSPRQLLQAAWQGAQTSFGVIKTLLLIGATIGVWMAAGTIATIVDTAMVWLNPHWFVLLAFAVCAVVSSIIGTSLGTVSVVGLPLMLIAKSGQGHLNLVAGAIMAGIYFGDRCSPMSSSASLVATVTGTKLFRNIRTMFATAWGALGLTVLGYGWLSWHDPLAQVNQHMLTHLQQQFHLSPWLLLPAALVLGLSLLRRPLFEAIGVSIIATLILGLLIQHVSLLALLQAGLLGLHQGGLITGGGVISMVNPVIIVFLSCSIAGILNKLQQLQTLKQRLTLPAGHPLKRYGITVLLSLIASMIGCNQSVAVVMTNSLVQQNYPQDKPVLAAELENTSILIAPLVPWNIAAFVPITVLGTSFAGYLPYAFYLYLVPLLFVRRKWH